MEEVKMNPKGFVSVFCVEWANGIDYFLDSLKECETREEVYALLMNELTITFVTKEV